MPDDLFQPSIEGEARLLLLIDAFSGANRSLQGRTKLAKLDFLLRYPSFFARALAKRDPNADPGQAPIMSGEIEQRMVRYRYGPWDPSYFALLGRLLGKGLIDTVPEPKGIGFRTTATGHAVARNLAATEEWELVAARTKKLRRYFDHSGTRLKNFIYETFPEVTSAEWGERL